MKIGKTGRVVKFVISILMSILKWRAEAKADKIAGLAKTRRNNKGKVRSNWEANVEERQAIERLSTTVSRGTED